MKTVICIVGCFLGFIGGEFLLGCLFIAAGLSDDD